MKTSSKQSSTHESAAHTHMLREGAFASIVTAIVDIHIEHKPFRFIRFVGVAVEIPPRSFASNDLTRTTT